MVGNMVIALGMPAIDDDSDLDDLTLALDTQVSCESLLNSYPLSSSFIVQKHLIEIRGKACLKSCPFLFQRDEDDVSPQNTPPHTPPFADTSNVLRKSSRIESGTKRSYNSMQSRHNGSAPLVILRQ
jgi:hypothetical protein